MKCQAETKSGKRCQNKAGENGFCHIKSHRPENNKDTDLTAKQALFVDAYLDTMNATEAARRAGYKGNDATLAQVGYENLRKPEIEKRIAELYDRFIMGRTETLMRLGKIARGSIMDVFTVQDGEVTLDVDKCKANGVLIQEITVDERRYQDGTKSVKYKVKLYPADQALVNIGRHHKLFVDRIEESGKTWIVPVKDGKVDDMDPNEWADRYGPGSKNGSE